MRRACKTLEEVIAGRQFAVESVTAALQEHCINLKWKRACTYNAAFPWVTKALLACPLEWELCIPTGPLGSEELQSAGDTPSVSSGDRLTAAGSADIGPEPPSPTPLVTDKEVSGASGAARTASSELGLSSGSSLAVGCVPGRLENFAKSWLPVKALELYRGSTLAKAAATMSEYDEGGLVGEGTFGSVTRAVARTSGQLVVLKRLKVFMLSEFLHEVCLLARMDHPNIVCIVDVCFQRNLAIVMEDCGVDLHGLVTKRDGRLAAWCSLMQQLLRGVQHMHSSMLVHSDIKPHNICIDIRNRLRIADLGNTVVSLPGYRSEKPRGSETRQAHLLGNWNSPPKRHQREPGMG